MRVWVWERVTGVEKALVLPLCQDQQGVNVNQCLIKEAKNGYLIIIIHFFLCFSLYFTLLSKIIKSAKQRNVKLLFEIQGIC